MLNASNAYGYSIHQCPGQLTLVLAPRQCSVHLADPTEGNAPLSVQFTDNSTGNVTAWSWNFGDGNTSTEQSPNHIYTTSGTYTISLNASNAYGYSISNPATITVLEPPAAAFTADPAEGNAPLTVQFTDNSTGNVTAWLWNFGDGNTSTVQNPTHTYATADTYTVTLNASNAYGFSVKTERLITSRCWSLRQQRSPQTQLRVTPS